MPSDSIKYQDLRSEKHTYKSEIGSKRIENPYTKFRQIFRCAQQHVQICRHISLVATYPSARVSAALGITKYNLLLLSLARQLQISRHISLVGTEL